MRLPFLLPSKNVLSYNAPIFSNDGNLSYSIDVNRFVLILDVDHVIAGT